MIAIGFSLIINANPGYAARLDQDDVPAYPTYVIQAGDTLSSIAVKFGVNLAELVNENNITDPNQVFEGVTIILPGIDWVQGELDVLKIPLGESYRSILRRYQIDGWTMGKLSGIVSPAQMFVGSSILLPLDRDQFSGTARAAVGGETSLLELAAANNANPWALASGNHLSGQWGTASGDVLFIPGNYEEGPGALPSPITKVEVSKGDFVQGKTTVIKINVSGKPLHLSGILLGRPFYFFEEQEGEYIALQGVHVMTPAGIYPFEINGITLDGAEFRYTQMVQVREGGYGSEKISNVDSSLLDPEVTQPEADLIADIVFPGSENRLWGGFFQAPTAYSDVVNSFFGTRRSFNGSPFEYYHSGVDFGGGKGVEIRAPAGGIVVMADKLNIRGNATLIDHGWGVYSGYYHQSEILVNVGDIVTPGQVIGLVGNSGRSSGAHLHWEMWVGGTQVEPMDWLFQTYP